ncbi:MAG: DNA adenine methylase [Candidatus Bruticola sp.]
MFETVKPFVKWAGGKSQLLNIIRKKYPKDIKKYCEPFVGGGAVLLDILQNYQPEKVMINDINPELINTYVQIKDKVSDIISLLEEMQAKFWDMDGEQRKEYYLNSRSRFNECIQDKSQTAEKAALFIFINKTCFNGLYRVNSKGFYNVPMGAYKKPLICDKQNLRLVSKLLKNVEIRCGSYSQCTDFIDGNTFVYLDPPYRPLNETSSFNSYVKYEFGDKQQIELSEFAQAISAQGAYVVASNSDPKNTNEDDNFFDDLYHNFTISRVKATRMINSKSSGRGNISELLIFNF